MGRYQWNDDDNMMTCIIPSFSRREDGQAAPDEHSFWGGGGGMYGLAPEPSREEREASFAKTWGRKFPYIMYVSIYHVRSHDTGMTDSCCPLLSRVEGEGLGIGGGGGSGGGRGGGSTSEGVQVCRFA